MINKMILNHKKIALQAAFALTGIFLLLNLFDLFWMVKISITIAYVLLLIIIQGYWKNSLGGLAQATVTVVMILISFILILLSWVLTKDVLGRSFMTMESFLDALLITVLLKSKAPMKFRAWIERWLSTKGYAVLPIEVRLEAMKNEKSAQSYRDYARNRAIEIGKTKPYYIGNQTVKSRMIRLIIGTSFALVGLFMAMYGLVNYPGGIFINTLHYWLMVIGIELIFLDFAIMFVGFNEALKFLAGLSMVMVVSTIALSQIVPLYTRTPLGFYVSMSLFLISLGIGLATWIRRIQLNATLGMMVYQRGSLWLGLELLLRDNLPMDHYETLMVITVTADDQFDLFQLMDLGPTIELFSQRNRLPFVGLRYDPDLQTAELYFITKNLIFAKRRLNRFFNRHFHYDFTITDLNDPLTIIDERLAPTETEMTETKNRNTVLHFEDDGFDLTQIHSVIIVLYFPDEVSLISAKAELEKQGYEKNVSFDDRRFIDEPASEHNGWFTLSIQLETRIGLDRINLMTRQIQRVLDPFNGKISHWGLGQIKEKPAENRQAEQTESK